MQQREHALQHPLHLASQCAARLLTATAPSRAPTPAVKGKILGQLAEADKNLVDGSDEFLQLLGTASYTQRVLMGRA